MHVFTHLKQESVGKTGKGIHADGVVEHDGHVGQLLQQLDDLGITENTIVLYTTDNGAELALWPDGAKTGFQSGDKNFKVHLDGYDLTELKGEAIRGCNSRPRSSGSESWESWKAWRRVDALRQSPLLPPIGGQCKRETRIAYSSHIAIFGKGGAKLRLSFSDSWQCSIALRARSPTARTPGTVRSPCIVRTETEHR